MGAAVEAPVAAAAPPPQPAAVRAQARPPNFSNLVGKAEVPVPVAVPAAPVLPDPRAGVQAQVMASVARISAFPAATLKAEQTLVGELGFDSLMLVELDADVGKAFPQLGGLPRELFSKTTTVGLIVDHVVKALQGGPGQASEPAAASTGQALVERYVPVVVPAPLHAVSERIHTFERPLLVTGDAHGLGELLVARLKAQGFAAELAGAPARSGYSGVIHLEGLGARGDTRAPARRVLELAQGLDAEKVECFVTVTGLGGRFGLEGVAAEQLGQVGALGFTKALAQEWPDATVKAFDVDPALPADVVARALVDELLSGDRACEVGLTREGRVGVALERQAAPRAGTSLEQASVVVVTGGARGLGLKFARALASRYGCAVALVGRSAPSDEAAKATASVKAAGARGCTYHQADVKDPAGVAAAVAAVRAAHGRIDAVVHAAGVLADGLVGSRKPAQLDEVVDTKVGGAQALLEATRGEGLALLVLVGSWAGRFGNAAQTAYSAANEMLARLAAPSTATGGPRVVAIDFPPFEESEMARKIPGFKKAELKAQGVTFLSDEAGLAAFLTEVASGQGEVLVGRNVPRQAQRHVAAFPVSRLSHVYLNDHTMAGQRVLPFAAALDHVAAAALEAAGASLDAPFSVTDFKLERAVLVPDTTWLEVAVTRTQPQGGEAALDVTLSQGHALSYRGQVRPGSDGTAPPAVKVYRPTPQLPMSLQDFYGGFTFHGPRLQGITAVEAVGEDGVVGLVKGCRPADWIKDPLRTRWAVDPLLLDASFQLAGYWAWVKHQRAGFPVALGRLVQLRPLGLGPVRCTVSFEAATEDVFTGTLVWQDLSGEVVAYLTGMQAEFKKRDPQFQAGAQAKASAPAAEVGAAAASPEAEGAVAAAVVAIDESTWNPARFPEYEELLERIQMAEAFGLRNPYFSVHEAICGDTTVVNGKKMINFSSYNYVGNSGDPVVSKAAQDAIATYGTSVSASRVASGEKPLTRELEKALADFFGTEDCIVLVSGHATNVSVVGHVVGAGDLVLHDALAHDSIIQGAKLSGAKRRPFPHNDFEALDRMLTSLRPHYRRVLIAIEGTYSMDGDIPELPRFIELKKKHHALLLVDEAHSAGVVGRTGRGVGEYFDVVRSDVDMWMGTLSKSFASCGGYIAGSHALVEYLKYTTPGFVYSVGISPPNAAAALAATQQILAHPERVQRCKDNAARFIGLLKDRGINTGMTRDTAVVPAIIGNSVLCLQVSDALKERGINVQPILYPAVEEDQARLRFFLSSLHHEEQLVTTANVLKEELDRLTRELTGDAVA
jgi:7-keto-8-aminopelargonate synthetase-like enzyme/NAD(P)-dependent dehydrogenase (short-subunit alcohol dehydrogenase family)/acyl carrier protein